MPNERQRNDPRHFFLNEHHELARGEKTGGGRIPEYLGIDWHAKGSRIRASLQRVRQQVRASPDPIRDDRYFVLARPLPELVKKSTDKRKAPNGRLTEKVDYGAAESRALGRLGLDLIQVNSDGSATVHARADRLEQLLQSATVLDDLGRREKARWATLDSFAMVPAEFVIDQQWLSEQRTKIPVDAIIELQPLLTPLEVDRIIRAIAETLRRPGGEALRGVGTDFSGRKWIRGKISRESLLKLANGFSSIQSMHPPLFSVFVASPSSRSTPRGAQRTPVVDHRTLPCVAVVDTGVPADHVTLAPYRRGQFISPDSHEIPSGDHGSMVASRVVFGDIDSSDAQSQNPTRLCAFYDVHIATDPEHVDEKAVLLALDAIVAVAPDVRVFNLSFDNVRPLDDEPPVRREEKLRLVQDLDNFIFARDVLVVVAAGNSPRGVTPQTPYPRHFDDPNWALGTWPRSFNALTCGGFANSGHADGVAKEFGAPSPFTKVGPGLCKSPKPDLSENAGNGNSDYRWQPHMGVWGVNAAGMREDRSGTSFAAPILAREAAFVFRELQKSCADDTKPFAAIVKAYLLLSAARPQLSAHLQELANVTLGKGRASSRWLEQPHSDCAMFLWQGILEDPSDLIRVQIPIPMQWHSESTAPRLRLVLAWDAPVNAAVESFWASRKVNVQLRVRLGTPALRGSRTGHGSYPVCERAYDLSELPNEIAVEDDLWLLELSYEQIAEYYPAIDFSPRQRIAFAAELFDEGEKPVSPQSSLQGLPVVSTMTRLSIAATAIRNPIMLKTRL